MHSHTQSWGLTLACIVLLAATAARLVAGAFPLPPFFQSQTFSHNPMHGSISNLLTPICPHQLSLLRLWRRNSSYGHIPRFQALVEPLWCLLPHLLNFQLLFYGFVPSTDPFVGACPSSWFRLHAPFDCGFQIKEANLLGNTYRYATYEVGFDQGTLYIS